MKKPTILVVDDDQDFAASLVDLIEAQECDADVVYSCEQALARYEQQVYDLVLLDVNMPGMDGIACLSELSLRHPDVQVVMLSGHYLEGTRLKLENRGLCGILEKPIDIDALIDTLERLKTCPVILVADDDPVCSYAVSRMLAAHGYRVIKAKNGREAVKRVKQGDAGLLILDLYMPDLNGQEVCQELLHADCMLPVILTTAFADSRLMQQELYKDYPVYDCMIKPVRPEQLYASVENVLHAQ